MSFGGKSYHRLRRSQRVFIKKLLLPYVRRATINSSRVEKSLGFFILSIFLLHGIKTETVSPCATVDYCNTIRIYKPKPSLWHESTSSKGNAYIRVFEDVAKKCRKATDKDDEFKGYVTVAYENIHVYNKEKDHYDTLDYVETTYFIWYKFVK